MHMHIDFNCSAVHAITIGNVEEYMSYSQGGSICRNLRRLKFASSLYNAA